MGAGKSTLLKHLLTLSEIARLRPALIVNEFGQEGVDGRLFDDAGWPLFEINRGSLFCVCTKADLLVFGGACPHCLIDIPGEEAPTDPGEELKKKQEEVRYEDAELVK